MEENNQQPSNPHITIPDPFEAYKASLDELAKVDPLINEFSRICYELFFMHTDGKKLWEILQDRFLLSTLVNPSAPQAETMAVYWAGFTDCIKQFRTLGLQHKQRINAV